MIRLPLLLVGFKTYAAATGAAAVELARMVASVGEDTGLSIVVIPQLTDIWRIRQETGVPAFAQHIDPVEPGSHTGFVLPEAVKESGAIGTLINHSERPIPMEQVAACIERAREVGLLSCVCSDSTALSRDVAAHGPDLILVENPALIGSGRAVSSADPEIITGALREVRKVDSNIGVICGAGISKGADVAAAIRLGVDGVGVASAVIKAGSPGEVLSGLARALLDNWSGGRRHLGQM